jgi:hypothetical protein
MEYIELYLCRDVYHCTPTDLDKIPYDTIRLHLEMIAIEHEVKEARRKA